MIYRDARILRKLILFLKEKCKIKYIDIQKYLDIPKSVMSKFTSNIEY